MNRRVVTALVVVLTILVLGTALGIWLTRPDGSSDSALKSASTMGTLHSARVTSVEFVPCSSLDETVNDCLSAEARLTDGPEKDTTTTVVLQWGGLTKHDLKPGDGVVLERTEIPGGEGALYSFSDYQRSLPLGILAAIFAVAVILIGRFRGVGALLGLVVTWLVISQYLLPAILDGRSPVAVAIFAGALICLSALYVAHGLSLRTTTAVVGTLTGLALTGLIALITANAARLTGQGAEEVIFIQQLSMEVNVQGLLLGGIIIGSLGVLNDVTVTQASAVWEIAKAQPTRNAREVYSSGMRVGRDHIASTVYTLVIAYVGASLPLLVLFSIANKGWTQTVTTSLLAEEVVRTLAGSIGLILAVPITTALAAFLVTRTRPGGDGVPLGDGAPDSVPDIGGDSTGDGVSAVGDPGVSRTPATDSSPKPSPTPTPDEPDAGLPSPSSDAPSSAKMPETTRQSGLATSGASSNSLQSYEDVALTFEDHENTGTISLEALDRHAQRPKGLLRFFRRNPENYVRKMSRSERRFWGEFSPTNSNTSSSSPSHADPHAPSHTDPHAPSSTAAKPK